MHIVSALTAYRILTFTHLGERHSIVSMGNWNSCSSELYENCFEQYNFGSNFHIWRKRKEQGQVSFWNKFEGLKFTKVTIFLNMRIPNLTLLLTKPSRKSLDEILFGVRNYPSSEQDNAVNLPRHSCMMLCWKMLWCFSKWNGIYREFSDTLKLQKLIWITWQLSKITATIDEVIHCSLTYLHDLILKFWRFEWEVPSSFM